MNLELTPAFLWGKELVHFRYPVRMSDIHHPDIHHLRHSSPIVVESDIHHPGHSSPQMFITSDFHHLSIHHPLGKIRHSSPQDLLHFCIVLYLLINFHIFKNMFTFSENQPWAEPNCMLWRKMTFTMMEKDQDMAKITLEEEVRNGKKIQIGKIIKLKKRKKKGFDKFEWRFCVDNLN